MTFDYLPPKFCFRIAPIVLMLAACAPISSAEEPAPATIEQDNLRHSISGLEIIPLTVKSGDTVHSFKTELADTPEAQMRGLMFRTEMADDAAMIFPSDSSEIRGFWMKNVPIPLDIIFIGPDGRISNIAAMTEPYSIESVYSTGPTSGVLELRGGLAAELGIEPGDVVKW